MAGCGRLVLCGALVLATGQATAAWTAPEPFRRDRIEGRDFDYNAESFLHRFSFQPKPALGAPRVPRVDGLRGWAGSSRSDELFVEMDAQVTLDFDTPAFAGYRFRRREDFDGHFDANLFGIGFQVGDFRFSVWGDVVAAKEDIDVHGELLWAPGTRGHLRLTLVAPDAWYNSKQDDGRYERQPYTYHVEGGWLLTDDLRLYGFINHNNRLRLREHAQGFRFTDAQQSAGVGLDVQLSETLALGAELEGLYGTRRRDGLAGPEEEDQRQRRQFGLATLELRHWLQHDLQAWYGLRYLHFDERDRQPRSDDGGRILERRESMAYGGVRWRWREQITLAPGVLVNYVDNREYHPAAPGEVDTDRGFYGKLTPAVEVLVDRRRGGTVSFNPTLRLHRAAFGGGNIQVNLPF